MPQRAERPLAGPTRAEDGRARATARSQNSTTEGTGQEYRRPPTDPPQAAGEQTSLVRWLGTAGQHGQSAGMPVQEGSARDSMETHDGREDGGDETGTSTRWVDLMREYGLLHRLGWCLC